MAIWNAQSIRAVWFISEGINTPLDEFFRTFFGVDPDGSQRNKSPNPQNPFFATANGIVDDMACEIQWQPGRFDIVISDNNEMDMETYPSFDTERGVNLFWRGVKNSANLLPEAFRLALATNLVLPVSDYLTGRNELANLTSFDVGTGDTSDFSLQLNKRKVLAGKYEANRLLRWSVLALQNMHFTMNSPSGGNHLPPSLIGVKYAASLLIDINTVPTSMTPISQNTQVEIFENFVIETMTLASERTVNSLMR